MGQRGPRKTPAAVKKARGTFRKDRDAEVEFAPPAGQKAEPPPKPEGLHDLASREWDRVTPLMISKGLLTPADWMAWTLGFAAYDTWLVASAQLAEHDLIVFTDKGFPCQNPLVAIAGKAWQSTLKWCREFGMTPSARSGLNIDSGKGAEVDPLTELLNRRGSAN
ncbi:MAG: phage terminase small subunit P27 family [Planctomycetaceae bacterium]|nr:phage terminase small subunit P27 family [Planctomycetaceae bacterium]